MADVIDIIHNLSYTADMSVIEAISKQFSGPIFFYSFMA